MTSEWQKEHERRVFAAFVDAAGLPVEKRSIQSPEEPAPDISCVISGKVRYFELTRIVDPKIAADIGYFYTAARRGKAPHVPGIHSYCDKELVRAAVERKQEKHYEVGGCRVDLLVYCDGEQHAAVQLGFVESELESLREEHDSKWGGIWLYDQPSGKVDSP